MSLVAKIVLCGIVSLTTLGMVHAETAEQMLARGPHGRRLGAPTTAAGWVKAGAICGAAEMAADQPPTTYICDCGTASMCSASYITQSVIGLALCTTQTYGTSGTGCHLIENTIPGTRRSHSEANGTAGVGNTYAMMADGIGVGDALAGGYVGTASYLVLTGSITYNTNDFLVASPDGALSYIAQMCVVPAANTTTTSFTGCGAKRTANPGAFKFSLYGYTWGDNYAAATTGKNYLVFRTKVCTKGMTQVMVNGVVNGTGIVATTTQVTSVGATQADGVTLTYAFPQTYLTGPTTPATAGNAGCMASSETSMGISTFYKCTPSRGRTVKITAQSATCGAGMTGIYVDYGFDTAVDLGAKERWFAYDPDVTTSSTTTSSGATTGGAAATGAAATSAGTTTVGSTSKAEHIASCSFLILGALFAVAART